MTNTSPADGAPPARWRGADGRLFDALRREAGLSLILAIEGVIIFVLAPLSATGWIGPQTLEAFRFGLAAAAVLTLTRRRAIAGLIICSFVVSILIGHVRAGPTANASLLVRMAITTVFDLAVAWAVARVAFGPGRVTVHRLMGGVILYLSLGLIFANLYRAAALTLHPSFSGLPADRRLALGQLLYFSLGTLTTSGTADILPLHPFVRSLANLEGVIGQLYPATLLARLVGLHASAAAPSRRDEG